MIADRGVALHSGDGGSGAGAGLVSVLAEGHVADPMKTILDVPFAVGPVMQLRGLGLFGRQ